MSADDSEDERRDPTEEPEYSPEPDQTHPKTRNGDDDRDDDAEDRAADDADASEARSEVAELSEQVGLDDESLAGADDSGEAAGSESDDPETGGGDEDSETDGTPAGAGAGAGSGEPAGTSSSAGSDDGPNWQQVSEMEDGEGEDEADTPSELDLGEAEGEGEPRSVPADLTSDPDAVEEEFGIDLSDTETVETRAAGKSYKKLTRAQQVKLRQALKERHGGEAVTEVRELVSDWKGMSEDTEAVEFEAITREALDVDAPLRVPDGVSEEQSPHSEPTEDQVAVYRDYARVSRAFLKEHYADEDGKMTVNRGIPRGRAEATADLTTQMFRNPNAERYELRTSVIANHSVAQEESEWFEDSYTLSYKTDVSNIGLMPQVVRNGMNEAEVHVVGGGVEAGEQSFGSAEYDQSFADLSDAIQNPAEADYEAHETIREAVGRVRSQNVEVDRQTAKNMIRYAHKTDSSEVTTSSVSVRVESMFTYDDANSQYEDLYESYNPETDTFET